MSILRESRTCAPLGRRAALLALTALLALAFPVGSVLAGGPESPSGATGGHGGGEASLVLPDLGTVSFYGIGARTILASGTLVCVVGMLFGFVIYKQLLAMPVHPSMSAFSELIFGTCKTYLITQGKFLLVLESFMAAIIVLYFGVLSHLAPIKVAVIVMFSLIGIAGSYGVAWFGIRINTLANSRTAFASLAGRPHPLHAIPMKAGMSIGMLLISVELILMLGILLLIPGDYAGACFIGFAIGESLGAAALRIAGGIFTKIADIGADLMKIVFKIKEDDARNPGVIADCTGDNAGDSIGPTADGFETYGVTGVALISFILLAVPDAAVQVQLLVWLFSMRTLMIVASGLSYLGSAMVTERRHGQARRMNFEHPLTQLVWITSLVSVALTYVLTWILLPDLGGGSAWWILSTIVSCGTMAGAIVPELVRVFTSTGSGHVKEIVTSSGEGGASLNVLSGFTAGNYAAFWLGLVMASLMGTAYMVSLAGLSSLMVAAPVFAFGLVAFGFLSMGPVTIAVDSYGPVTDNAQSIYELSLIEQAPGIRAELEKSYGFSPDFKRAKELLEENDGAGNTFKATAKPVLIGTAVVGATTMIFSIVVVLTHGLTQNVEKLSILHPPFVLGMMLGGAMIYWFTGAATQAVVTGAYRAVQFIKANIRLEGVERASEEDSKRVVEICTRYAQKGMFNIFLAIFFGTLALACADPYFFIGYLISLAIFGLFQALFLANAGGAWDNAKKVVETDMGMKGTDLHAATVVGDTVGDPFKDTSSVAMNPMIKFTTLFGLLAVELALQLDRMTSALLAVGCVAVALFFIHRSFYGMRIQAARPEEVAAGAGGRAGAGIPSR